MSTKPKLKRRYHSITEAHGIKGTLPFVDSTQPRAGVQIEWRDDEQVLWVHVDGQTVLRVCRIPVLEVKGLPVAINKENL